MGDFIRVSRLCHLLLGGLISLVLATNLGANEREKFVHGRWFFDLPRVGIGPEGLGVVVNGRDPDSIRIGRAYVAAHGIPAENVVFTDLPVRADLSAAEANAAIEAVWHALPECVQGLALAWMQWPHTVEQRMSITTAFAMRGYRPEMAPAFKPQQVTSDAVYAPQCFSADGRLRGLTAIGTRPRATYGLLPAMLLAGETLEESLALIERSAEVEGCFPEGALAAFVHTQDRARDVRRFATAGEILAAGAEAFGLEVQDVEARGGSWTTTTPLFFHFLGAAQVAGLDTMRYAPGGVGDHMTSFGGLLTGQHNQTVVLAHLRQGASGSYGTVAEPGNAPGAFPDPSWVVSEYLGGRTLLQAYWSSVARPGYGLFVGDPLTRPFAGVKVVRGAEGDLLYFPSLTAGRPYRLWVSANEDEEETLHATFVADSSPELASTARGGDHALPAVVHRPGWTSLRLPSGHGWTHFRVEAISPEAFAQDVEERDLDGRLFADSNAPRDGFEYSPWYGWIYTRYVDRSRPDRSRGWVYSAQFGWQYMHVERTKPHFFIYDQGEFSRLRMDASQEPVGEAGWSYFKPSYFRTGCFLYNYSLAEWIRYRGYEQDWLRAHLYEETMKRSFVTRPDNSR